MVENSSKRRLVVITTITAPYRIPTFRELARRVDLHVLFSASSESNREWSVTRELPFAFQIIGEATVGRGGRAPVYASPRLWRHLLKRRPDAVMVRGYSAPAIYAATYCRRRNAALIEFSEGTAASESDLGRAGRLGHGLVARIAGAAVGTSSAAIERLIELGIPADRCFRSPYALDLTARPTRVFGHDADARLLFVGQLVRRKGLAEVLRELAMVDGLPATLMVAGSGPERRPLELLTHVLGLHGRVRFTGFIDQPDLPALYAQHDLLVVPTLSDTFGVATLEATAAGLPVIASVHAGWTCDPLQPGSIALALGTPLRERDSWSRIGRHNRDAVQTASPEASADAIVAAMDRALASV